MYIKENHRIYGGFCSFGGDGEIGVTTPEQVEAIAKNACIPGETIHNLAGDVQPIELYDAIMQADAMGKIALDK